MSKHLTEAGLKFHIKGRTKSIHSIWQKMKKQKCGVDGIYDLFAIRIILDSPLEKEKMQCWQAYSIVTDMYQPNPKRLRDWISVPKSNGYECLHITVLGPEQKWVEVQIRSERMNELAEKGYAAHYKYKHAGEPSDKYMDEWIAKVRDTLEQAEVNAADLVNEFKLNLLVGEIFVFTPNGDLRKLPEGATVLDFAFDIHSNLGCSCSGGKINGRAVPIKETLHNGDIVEILTQKNQTPKADWLSAVKTAKARSRIQQYLRTEERAAAMGLGRRNAGKEARKAGINLSKAEKDGHLSTLVNSLAPVSGRVDGLHRVRAFHDQAGGEAFAGHCFAAGNP